MEDAGAMCARKAKNENLRLALVNLAAGLSPAVPSMVAGLPASFLMGAGENGISRDTARSLLRKLKPGIRGIKGTEQYFSRQYGKRSELKRLLMTMLEGNAFFDPDTKKIVMSPSAATPGVLAHEMGHAANYRDVGSLLKLLRAGGGAGIAAGSIVPMFTDRKDTGRTAAMAGSAAALPMLGEEAVASARGFSALPKDLAMLRRIKSFIGLPTYAAAAAAPLVTHEVKEHLGGYKAAYAEGFMEKSGWMFSVPLGMMGTPTALMEAPYYGAHAVTGPTEEDPTGRAKSLGLGALAGLFGLFGLGFAGAGVRDLGSKLAIMAARARGRPMVQGLREMAHRMDVPAYARHSAAGERMMGPAGKYLGYASGGIAHPFNKLEDAITGGLQKALGPAAAEHLGARMRGLGGLVAENPAVRFASSPWMIAPMVAGGMALQPDLTPEQLAQQQYEEQYGQQI